MPRSSTVGRHGDTAPLIDEQASNASEQEPLGSLKWSELAQAMQSPRRDLISDAPDWEENVFMPAGYTYLGQFAAHDLTFDTTSSLVPPARSATNLRTPRFDLDCLYGAGPIDQPYLYDVDRATLIVGRTSGGSADLIRTRPSDPRAARAIIGDPRNDENAIICQLHLAFIRFHNEIVKRIGPAQPDPGLFERARNEVRWTYQRILLEDFLPRLIRADVIRDFEARRSPNERGRSTNAGAYRLFPDRRDAVPPEFSQAAYRFGHSMVRDGYRMNWRRGPVRLFGGVDDLVGLEPLEDDLVIDSWSIFFPDSGREGRGVVPPGSSPGPNIDAARENRVQFAYKIDTSLVDPLANLPPDIAGGDGTSLPLRTLLRGRKSNLPSGQSLAERFDKPPLDPIRHLRTRRQSDSTKLEFVPIDQAFVRQTPLWFYVLAEAQAPIMDALASRGFACDTDFLLQDSAATGTQLGWVGGRIVLETFHGLLDEDPESYRNHPDAGGWEPMINNFRMWDLVTCNFRDEIG